MTFHPYVFFSNGQCAEAFRWYQQIFGGELRISTYGEYGHGDAASADKVMHAQLDTPSGYTLMASDAPEGMDRDSGSSITISISGDDEADLRGYWDGLTEGGAVMVPLEKQMWGDAFGMCTDRFGIRWMVNISGAQGA